VSYDLNKKSSPKALGIPTLPKRKMQGFVVNTRVVLTEHYALWVADTFKNKLCWSTGCRYAAGTLSGIVAAATPYR
jgi:hypothetical protein